MERERKIEPEIRRPADEQVHERSAWTAIASQVAESGTEVAKAAAAAATGVWATKKLSDKQSEKKD